MLRRYYWLKKKKNRIFGVCSFLANKLKNQLFDVCIENKKVYVFPEFGLTVVAKAFFDMLNWFLSLRMFFDSFETLRSDYFVLNF